MGVDSILGGNFSVQTKDFTKRTTSGATDVNQHRGYQSQKNWKILKKRFGKK